MCCSAKSCIQFPLELSKAFLPAVSKLVPQKTDYSDAGKEELALLQLLSCEHSARSDPHPSLVGFDPTSSSLPQQVPGGCQSPPCVLLTSPCKKDGKNRNPGTYLLNKPPRCKHAAILMFFPISHLRDTPPAVVVCRGLGLCVCVCVCPRQPVFFLHSVIIQSESNSQLVQTSTVSNSSQNREKPYQAIISELCDERQR